MKLEPPDCFYLSAAMGWLGLGDCVSAKEEIDRITPENRVHPDVLQVRYEIYAGHAKWNVCLAIASLLIIKSPDRWSAWVQRSTALGELRLEEDAFDNLLLAVQRFPKNPLIAYHLACYSCKLGRLDQAIDWMEVAFNLGNPDELRCQARDNPDLKLLWPCLEKI